MKRDHRLLRHAAKAPRILLGILLMFGGLLGFPPILGFLMLPPGAVSLAREAPPVAADANDP